MSAPEANVSEPAARRGIRKRELTHCHSNPPGERQRAGSVTMNPEARTHSLSCQSPRRASASRLRGRGSRRGSSLSVTLIPQENFSKPAARRGVRKWELTFCHVNPPGERQRAGTTARDLEGELAGCHVNPPGEHQQAGSVARDPESGTHTLSCQSPRRMSASRQRGKGSRRCNSPAVMSIPQANVSKPAACQRIQKVELTRCHVNPPGKRQQAGSVARGSE